MRFVPADRLKPGQVAGSDLIYDVRRVLLREGMELTEAMIGKIRQMGFQGIYVEDDISRGIRIGGILQAPLYERILHGAHALLLKAGRDPTARLSREIDALKPTLHDAVVQISEFGASRAMVNRIDIRAFDEYLYRHSVQVMILSTLVGADLGLSLRELDDLALGALLHDIGTVFVERAVTLNQNKLRENEYVQMRQHSQTGYNFLYGESAVPMRAKEIALTHHEQYDGQGYPERLAGQDIPLFGRIVGAVDVYDALLSARPYRAALMPWQAVDHLIKGYETLFDPLVINSMLKKIAPYPKGTCLKLNDGSAGIVVETYEYASLRPKLRLLTPALEPTGDYVDLAHEYTAHTLEIAAILDV